jgi:hypothetical protein
MDPTISYQNLIRLYKYSDDSLVSATIVLDPDTYLTATIDPVSNLDYNTQYYIKVSGAKDMVGNYLTDYTTKADQEFTTVAISAPTVLSQTPTNGSTDQAITIEPTITFSKDMATSTINLSHVQLRKYDDDSMVNSTFSYNNKVATIKPTSPLLNNTQYYIWVSGVKDLDGNSVTAYTNEDNQKFTTVAQDDGSWTMEQEIIKQTAIADNTYTNGWAWKFTITVPTSETSFNMKFNNWTSSLGNSIESAGNMRYYSAQATTATSSANAIEITATNEYPATAMTLTGDLDASTAGRQIEVYVEMKIPVGSSGDSYSASYGIKHE